MQQQQPGLTLGGAGVKLGGLGQQATGGGLQLGQTLGGGGGLQLGQQIGGQQIGGLQPGQLGQTPQASGGLQLGQGKPTLSVGGLQLGGTSQAPTGLQMGLNQGAGLQIGQTNPQGQLQLGQSSAGTLLGQSTKQQLGQTTAQTGLSGGLQLGGLVQASQAQKTGVQLGGLQLGQTSQATGLQMGQTSQAGGLQIGQTTQATGLQIGQNVSQATGLKLGQTTQATSGLQLGQIKLGASTASSTAATGIGLGLQQGGLSLTQQQAATTTTTAKPAGTSTITGLGGVGLQGLNQGSSGTGVKLSGLTTTATNSTTAAGTVAGLGGVGLGLGGLKQVTTASTSATAVPSLGLGLTTTSTAVTAAPTASKAQTMLKTEFKGLGGMGTAETIKKGAGRDGSSLLSEPVPDILAQLITGFETFLKNQKAMSDLISKYSDTSMKKVLQDTSTQSQVLAVVSSQVQKDAQTVSFLAQETSEELRNAELARRTHELPAWLQKENTAPDVYFQNLVASFEAKMELYRRQIEELECHLSAISSETAMSPQNIIEILQLQYKPFLLLAAQLQVVHEQVQNLKEQYLSYRKVFLQDSTDVFEEKRKKVKSGNGGGDQVQIGPSPFTSVMGQASVGLANGGLQGVTAGATAMGGQGLGGLAQTGLGGLGNKQQQQQLGIGLGGLTVGGGGTSSLGGLGGLGGTLGGGAKTTGLSLGLGQSSALGGGGGATGLGGLGSSISQPSLGSMPATMPVTKPVLPLQQQQQQQGTQLQGQQQQQQAQQPFVLGKPPAGRKRNA